jgi:YHS domain-containing protein
MKRKLFILLVFTLIGTTMQTQAQKIYHNDANIAIDGYDVVSYFTDGKAVKGKVTISTIFMGSQFNFSSETNKNSFLKTPKKFIPQYDGYCAYAVAAMNKKVPSNPETFKIVDGKLYLFFNDLYEGKQMNTIVPWNEDETNLLSKAEGNWKALEGN